MSAHRGALNIKVVGLGQAGGNLAAEFFRRGYSALALNTAETDLRSLGSDGAYPALPPERRLYIGMDGYDGAGADPIFGQHCIREQADAIRQAIGREAADADVLIVAAGLGGGTGSAVAELFEVLKDEHLPLVALLTLPFEAESALAKVNAVRAISDAMKHEIFGWIFVDNERLARTHSQVSIADYFAGINSEIVGPLDALNTMGDDADLRAIRSFDGEDLRKLLLHGGLLNFATIELPEITTDEVTGSVRDALEASEIMPSGFQMARLSYLGIVIEAGSSTLASTSISIFKEIEEQLKAETVGGGVHMGIHRLLGEAPTILRMIATTQALPERLREFLAEATHEGTILGQKVSENLGRLDLGELTEIELFRTNTRPSERPHRARAGLAHAAAAFRDLPAIDFPDATNAPPRTATTTTRARNRRRPPPRAEGTSQARGHDRELTDEDPKELGTDEIDVIARLSNTEGTSDLKVGRTIEPKNLGTPEIYDHLVSAYRRAPNARSRQEVVRRLEEDGTSASIEVRYYAVEAMAKLGSKIFGDALQTATEDDDEAVRNLAIRALKG